jgi:divalent metal cation (Fe/Co/Zn/Cd) transporter
MVLGPNAVLVAARIDLRDALDGERVERASTEIDHRLREVVPDVTEVFLDATPTREFSEVVRRREDVALRGPGV